MTYEEIIAANKNCKVFAGMCQEDATDFAVMIFDTDAEAREYCMHVFDKDDGVTVVDVAWVDMEVPDQVGYYSGSHGRYSRVPMMFPVTQIDE